MLARDMAPRLGPRAKYIIILIVSQLTRIAVMERHRRKYTGEFKAKIALETI